MTDGLDHGTDEWVAAAVELQAQQQRQEERKDEGARIAAAKRAAEEERIRALRHAAQHQAEEARQREEDEVQYIIMNDTAAVPTSLCRLPLHHYHRHRLTEYRFPALSITSPINPSLNLSIPKLSTPHTIYLSIYLSTYLPIVSSTHRFNSSFLSIYLFIHLFVIYS